MLNRLKERFTPDALTATRRFNEASLELKDIALDDQALIRFVQRKIRCARAMLILNTANTNWQGVMTQIWSSMDMKIKQYLPLPTSSQSLTEYMQRIEESRSILLAAALDRYPYLQKKPSAARPPPKAEERPSSSYKPSSSRHSSDRRRSTRSSSSYPRDRSDRYRDGNRDRDRDRDRNRDGNRYRDGNRDRSDRDRRDKYDRRDREQYRENRRHEDRS
jgi:hypothetical protein